MNMVDERGATPPPVKAIVVAVVASLLVMVVTVVSLVVWIGAALNKAETTDDHEKAYEEGLKRWICAFPAAVDATDEQKKLRDEFCALPPQIDLQRYLDEHS